jgi:hypothetical protein
MAASLAVSIALLARVMVDNAPNQLLFDTARIEELTGAKGVLDEKAGVFKVGAPRWDLKVTAAGVHLTPAMGLSSWAAFKRAGNHTALTGEVVLTEDQVNVVLSAVLDHGLQVTALQDHFFWDTPKVMFLRFEGTGEVEALAQAVGAVLAAIRTTAGGKVAVPRADIDPAKSTLDPRELDGLFAEHGAPGVYRDGVYRVIIRRPGGSAKAGLTDWATLAGSDDKAVIAGDFAVSEPELPAVLKTLHRGGVNVIGIHQHVAGEAARTVFLHYWGIGRAPDLVETVIAALRQKP